MSNIIRNSAKCAHCPVELVSTHRHDFKTHICSAAGKVAQSYNHDLKEYVPDYPSFSVDGGTAYIRRTYTREEDYIETSRIAERRYSGL